MHETNTAAQASTEQWAQSIADKIIAKMRVVAERNQHAVPYTTGEDGRFDDHSAPGAINWWTNGFWGGLMWQLHHATGDDLYRTIAEELEGKLDAVLMNYDGLDHDNGFKWLPTAVADWRETGNQASRNRALLAAANMAGRFNPAGNFIRAWNSWDGQPNTGRAIIDCMMNLPLLYWASTELDDPRFKQIAVAHANTAQQRFVRADGSVRHIIDFDPETGEYLGSQGGQGYGHGSSWTRGQAWAIYGFALSYIHTRDQRYLDTAKRVANYFIANTPANGLIPVDFRQPDNVTWEDSTAAAIAACGMLEIAKQCEGETQADARIYRDAALRLLKALADNRVLWDEGHDNLLTHCTAAYHDKEHEFAIIYGDYYFVEAIWKLTGRELFIW